MKTEELIGWFKEKGYRFVEVSKEFGFVDNDTVIECLQRGLKFEKIVKELEEEAEARNHFIVPGEYLAKKGGVMEYLIKTLKRKYFPKQKKEYPFRQEERHIKIVFQDGESIDVKLVVTKQPNGRILISSGPLGDTLETGYKKDVIK